MSENLNIERTVEAWAEITVKEWHARLNQLNIGVTGALYDSIQFTIKPSDGIPDIINFEHNHYGIFVETGTGRGISKGNTGDLGFTPKRKPKRWFTPVLNKEVVKLTNILASKYAIMCNGIIAYNFMGGDDREKAPKKAPSLGRPGDWKNDSGGAAPAQRELRDIDLYWMKKNGLI
jgi:hypothetical protein